jgi:uncharacterized protein
MPTERTYTAFAGDNCVASGPLRDVLLTSKGRLDAGASESILFFEDDTGKQVDFDFRGTPDQVVARALPATPGPGRPKLGVVAREVTLLPRHWAWLEQQPGGISASLRLLVEKSMRRDLGHTDVRQAIEATSRMMTALAGDRPGYEDASRALFAQDWKRFETLIRPWPKALRDHLQARLLKGTRRAGKKKRTS